MSIVRLGINYLNFDKIRSQNIKNKFFNIFGTTIFINSFENEFLYIFLSSRKTAKYLNHNRTVILIYVKL